MAPKVKVTRESIIEAAVEIVRKVGIEGLNARVLATALGSSTQPIFSNFSSMSQLTDELIAYAYRSYRKLIERIANEGKYPSYKSSGMAYIRFAKEERELFKLLFMRNTAGESEEKAFGGYDDIISNLARDLSLSQKDASSFHFNSWAWVHGVAVMAATGYLSLEEDVISGALSVVFNGLKAVYCNKNEK